MLYILLSNLLNVPLQAQAAGGDDYLRQIEAEAKQQATLPITTRSLPTPSIEVSDQLPLGLQQEEFEKVLRERFAGTYVFYERLTPQNKNRVFSFYKQDNRVGTIREQTLKLLTESVP